MASKECTVKICDRLIGRHGAKGLCRLHYQRLQANGSVDENKLPRGLGDLSYLYGSRIYGIWASMKGRCSNPKSPAYKWYGAKGITCDPKWNSFEGFYADMAKSYSPELTLDRINGTQGYSKENCRWATMKVQQNNRSNNRSITINGQTKTLSQWIEESTVKPLTVKSRLYRGRWPVDKALGMAQQEAYFVQ